MTKVYMKVERGAFVPADATQYQMLKDMTIKVGDVVKVDVELIRNKKFNNLVHKIGDMVSKNIPQFSGLDAHTVIKRIQLEGCIECDIIALQLDGFGIVEHRVPRSIAFDKMSEVRYKKASEAICEHIRLKYWQSCTDAEIEQMAELFIAAN